LEKLKIRGKITLIGIAKKLEEIYFPGDNIPVYLDKNSYTLKLIQQIRNEAHRFGITFHRNKRSSGMIKSVLDTIKGIGPKTKEILLKEYESVNHIRDAGEEKLVNLVGKSKASLIMKFLLS
jgi:excinuclease ABC subunit C